MSDLPYSDETSPVMLRKIIKVQREEIEKLKAENELLKKFNQTHVEVTKLDTKTIVKLTRQRDVMKKALEFISNNENNFKIITAINALKEAEGME